jgi:hypothetical protein
MRRIALILASCVLASGAVYAQTAPGQRGGPIAEEIPAFKVAVYSVPNEILRNLGILSPGGFSSLLLLFEAQQSGAQQADVGKVGEFGYVLPVVLIKFLENSSEITSFKTGTILAPKTAAPPPAPQPKGSLHVSTNLGSTPVDIDLTIEPAMPRVDEPIHVSVAATHCLREGVVPAPGMPRCENPSRSYKFRLLDGEVIMLGGIVGGNRTESGHRNSPELLITITPVAPPFTPQAKK